MINYKIIINNKFNTFKCLISSNKHFNYHYRMDLQELDHYHFENCD